MVLEFRQTSGLKYGNIHFDAILGAYGVIFQSNLFLQKDGPLFSQQNTRMLASYHWLNGWAIKNSRRNREGPLWQSLATNFH